MDEFQEKKGEESILDTAPARAFFAEIQRRIEPIREAIPYPPLRQWIKEAFEPTKTIDAENNTSIFHAIVSFVHYMIVLSLVQLGVLTTMTCGLGVILILIYLVLLPIIVPLFIVSLLLYAGLVYLLAILAEGNGSYGLFLNKSVTVMKIYTVTFTLSLLPAMIPVVGFVWLAVKSPFDNILFAYLLYLEYYNVKKVFSLSPARSLLVVASVVIITTLVFIMMYLLLLLIS